ncbi:hypothetical protein CWI38_2176p0040, partial [Hamiltosporidium tvaerminnensis]
MGVCVGGGMCRWDGGLQIRTRFCISGRVVCHGKLVSMPFTGKFCVVGGVGGCGGEETVYVSRERGEWFVGSSVIGGEGCGIGEYISCSFRIYFLGI